MTNHDEDIETLSALGPVVENGEWIQATPSVAIRFTADNPLSSFPGKLDQPLARAYDLIAPVASFYGGEEQYRGMGFRPSRGRKPQTNDREAFSNISALMLEVEQEDRKQKRDRHKHLQEQGITPQYDPETIRALDGGSVALAEKFPISESGSHITLIGSTPWRASISFGLDLYRQNAAEIEKLAEDVAATGAFDSGSFGFALNIDSKTGESVQERLFLPMTRRFRLLNPIDVFGMRITALEDQDVFTLFPLGAWYFLSKAVLSRFSISEDSVRALKDQVFEVAEYPHSFLIKLYERPVLGDVNYEPDLAPALAVTAALKPGFANTKAGRLSGMAVGYEADRYQWYRRFLEA